MTPSGDSQKDSRREDHLGSVFLLLFELQISHMEALRDSQPFSCQFILFPFLPFPDILGQSPFLARMMLDSFFELGSAFSHYHFREL